MALLFPESAVVNAMRPRLRLSGAIWYCVGRRVWGAGLSPQSAYASWEKEVLSA